GGERDEMGPRCEGRSTVHAKLQLAVALSVQRYDVLKEGGASHDSLSHSGRNPDSLLGRYAITHHDYAAWASAHDSRGCSQEGLISTGGDGLFYCFALPAE